MLERICPNCEVPMPYEKCIKCGNNTETISKLYWCKTCNIPLYDKTCSICGNEAEYISTDLRPVFPEESLLLALINEKEPDFYQ